jgi:phosphoribosylformimino-5-aminoimidazole carboxamide ribonucleotide (ProFAR) isomerase
VAQLIEAGVRRLVLSHGGAAPDLSVLGSLAAAADADILVAGGVTSIDMIARLRDAGVQGVILGEVLFTGAIDLATALHTAA